MGGKWGRPGYGRVEVPGPGHGPPVVAHVEDDVVVDDVALWPKPPIVFPHQGVKGDSQAKGYHQTNRPERDYPANTRTVYSLLLICAHGRIRSNLETFCKNMVLLVTTMDIVVKTLSY